jgi:hypothetical protein
MFCSAAMAQQVPDAIERGTQMDRFYQPHVEQRSLDLIYQTTRVEARFAPMLELRPSNDRVAPKLNIRPSVLPPMTPQALLLRGRIDISDEAAWMVRRSLMMRP